MPNWVSNTLDVHGDIADLMVFTAEVDKALDDDRGFIPHFILFPENGHKQVLNGITVFAEDDPEAGTIDGYQWATDNWGVKWGDCHTHRVPGGIQRHSAPSEGHHTMGSSVYTLTFDTAWAYPDKAMLTISAMYPNLSFVLCSVEEQPAFRAIHVYEKGDSHGVTDQLLDIFDAPNWDKDEERAEEYWEIVGQEVRRTVLPAGRFREWELTVEKIHSMALKGRAWNNALAQ